MIGAIGPRSRLAVLSSVRPKRISIFRNPVPSGFLPGESMSRRRFEVFDYRQVLARMRQGDSDRDIAAARLMGRGKLKTVTQVALDRGWLDPGRPLPDRRTGRPLRMQSAASEQLRFHV
jgi:hypothetical protein